MSNLHLNSLASWSEDGCLSLANAIAGSELKAIQKAFVRNADQAKETWRIERAAFNRVEKW